MTKHYTTKPNEPEKVDSLEVDKPSELVSLTIDGIEVAVPKGTLLIRAAEQVGIAIPRFCDHPLLDPVGACRQCMVEIPDMGNGRGAPKPQASCTIEVAPGMKVATQVTSPVAEKTQAGMLEFLLINHPLDCPICDKGGECPLQNQAIADGRAESRYDGYKRTYPKPVAISANILLDRERCVLCARCTRFSDQISGDQFIALVERGALQQVGFYSDHPYDSYYSGNVVQICPVGALTSADYRFQSRPFDLVSTETSCEICASGCALRTDHRHFSVRRRLAGADALVNEEWNCDKGRFAFKYGRGDDRIKRPLVRRDGVLEPASWYEAIDAAVAGLTAAGSSVGVLTGGRLTLEASYGFSKFARTVLGTNSIDFRSRPASDEEASFLAAHVAGKRLGESVRYSDFDKAKRVVLVAFEPEDESPIVLLRLRRAVRKLGLQVTTIAPFASRGSQKLNATVVACAPGDEAEALAGLELGADTIVLVGERAAMLPGVLSAVVASGARFAWVPRRAGDVGAIEAGCLPGLLPGGRQFADAAARVDLASHWGAELPQQAGLTATEQFAAAVAGTQKAFVVAGVQTGDFGDPAAAIAALEAADFVVSFEQRESEVTRRADVVFPVVLLEETAGTFLNWEHRPRRVNLVNSAARSPMSDLRVLAALADAMGRPLGFRAAGGAMADFAELGTWDGEPASFEAVAARPDAGVGVRLASWRQLLDDSAVMSGADALKETAPVPVAKASGTLAARLGDTVRVTTSSGSVTLPLVAVDGMVEDVVWLPANSGANLNEVLGVSPGAVVDVAGGAK